MDIMRLLAERRTFRRFAQTPIPADVIADVIEAVRLSSCGANRQALRLVIADPTYPASILLSGGPLTCPRTKALRSLENSPLCMSLWCRIPPSPEIWPPTAALLCPI